MPIMLIIYIAAVVVIAAVIILIVVLVSNKNKHDQIYEVDIPVPEFQPTPQPQPTPIPDPREQFVSGDTMYLFQGSTPAAPAAAPVPQPVPRKTYVIISDIADPTKSFKREITPVNPVVIGRRMDQANVVIDYNQTISSTHCRIELINGAYYISDAGSRNGTLINSVPVAPQTPIANGQIIQLGAVSLRINFSEE